MNLKNSSAATPVQDAVKPKFVNLGMIGSGWQNDGSRFINITFDRDVNMGALIQQLQIGNRLSLQPLKAVNTKSPARKYVLVLRGPQENA